ncbi:transposase, partial [Shigella dysenteriae]
HASTLKSPSYTKSVSWQHCPLLRLYFSSMIYSLNQCFSAYIFLLIMFFCLTQD